VVTRDAGAAGSAGAPAEIGIDRSGNVASAGASDDRLAVAIEGQNQIFSRLRTTSGVALLGSSVEQSGGVLELMREDEFEEIGARTLGSRHITDI
jgi:hypothetical protein